VGTENEAAERVEPKPDGDQADGKNSDDDRARHLARIERDHSQEASTASATVGLFTLPGVTSVAGLA
jgi:hypothetical protein